MVVSVWRMIRVVMVVVLAGSFSTSVEEGRSYHISYKDRTYHYTDAPTIKYKLGKGMCLVEHVAALNLTFPLPWTHGTFCTHPTQLRQQCCHGFNLAPLERGCPVVKEVVDVLSAGRVLGCCDMFLHLLPPYTLAAFPSAITILLPHDQGFREAEDRTNAELNRVVGWEGVSVSALLLYHTLPRRWYVRQLHHGQRLPSLYQHHTITVTRLHNKMVLFNCVPVSEVDLPARDGVLHILPRPMPPAYTATLAGLLSAHPRLTSLFSIMGFSDLLDLLREGGPLTLLAPTNDAFDRLPKHYLDSITYDPKYRPALVALSRHHLINGRHCSLGLAGRSHITTAAEERVSVTCRPATTPAPPLDPALTLGPATVTYPDIVASNGVIHLVDRVLVPRMALSLAQVARDVGATAFIRLVRRARLWRDLVSFGPYTIFAPSNQALTEVTASLGGDEEAVRQLVLYHLVPGSHASHTLRDTQTLPSRLPAAPHLTVKLNTKAWSVNDGVVVVADQPAFNGYVHVVDRVLSPPSLTLARALALTPALSRFTTLVSRAGVWAWRELSQGVGPYTLFAVRDPDIDTWAGDTFTYYRLLHDSHLLNQSVKSHLVRDLVMPRVLEEGTTSVIRTLNGLVLDFHLASASRPSSFSSVYHSSSYSPYSSSFHHLSVSEGRLSLRHATIFPDSYILCSNGIILFIDALLLPAA